jgi:hypothetical protein
MVWREIDIRKESSGAYGVRYHFVIYGFSVAETENLTRRFLLGRAPEPDHLEPF